MNTLSPHRFGLALGASAALFYLACVLFMAVAPDAIVVWVFNSLLHGIDIASIVRERVSLSQSAAGIAGTFLSGYLFGAVTAWVYNLGIAKPGNE